MVYPGFLRIGGTEIVNTERARGYAESSDCPKWLVQEKYPCESLQDALGDDPYHISNIPQAPWYDLSLPDISGRFYGVVGLGFKNLLDSSRSASLTEGTSDGGTIGRMRKGAKQPRVRATLLSRGDDAMEYGLAWLNSAFDGNCSQHGDACGVTDMEFLTDCPPVRGQVQEYGAWAESARNYNVNPAMTNSVTGWSVLGTGITQTPTADGTRIDFANGAPSGQLFLYQTSSPVAAEAEVWSGAIDVTVPLGYPSVTLRWDTRGYTGGSSNSIGSSANVVINPGETVRLIAVSPPLIAGANGVRNWLNVAQGATVPVGARVVVRRASLVKRPEVGEYFDGASAPVLDADGVPVVRYSWAGAANASASIEETRSPFTRPQTDAEYYPIVDRYRRFMHEVSVTSGPIIVEQRTSIDGEFRVTTVEWTVSAERPWIYSLTRPVQLPVTPTTVLQDIPYNLVPRPSAELSSGTVVIATNYSLNPSLETNATGWAATPSAVTGTDPTSRVTSGRVTGELQAVGSSSFRARLLGDGVSASGRARIQIAQTVDVSTRPAGSRVSATIWGALLSIGPATPLYSLVGTLQWLTAADAAVGSPVALTAGPGGLSGNIFSAKSLVVPATATKARVILASEFDWTSGTTNSDVRMYADALAVTVP